MKIIVPTPVTDANLTSSTAPEPAASGETTWNAATNYSIGNLVSRATTHRVYENLIAGVNAGLPEESPTRWLDIGPTNRWAMFDDEIGSVTTIASPLTVVIDSGSVGGVALLEIIADTVTVTLKDAPGGTTVYSYYNDDLDAAPIASFWDWLFLPYEQLDSITLTDLPDSFTEAELTVTLTGSGDVSLGVLKFGSVISLGGTEYNCKLGIIDYSRKDTNEFGRTVITQRRFARTLEGRALFDQSELSKVYRTLSAVRAVACVYVGGDSYEGYEALTVFGFFRDFSIDVAYPTANYCSFQIEGLT